MPQYEGTAYQITDDTALASYLDTACWSSRAWDEHGNDRGIELYAHRLTRAARATLASDLADFLGCPEVEEKLIECEKRYGYTPVQAAGDFWLSRNGHGAGFFDRGLGELGQSLHRDAKAWGSADLYLGRGGWIHHS